MGNGFAFTFDLYTTLILTIAATFLDKQYGEKLKYITKPILVWVIISIIFHALLIEFRELHYFIGGSSSLVFLLLSPLLQKLPVLFVILAYGFVALAAGLAYLNRKNSLMYVYAAWLIVAMLPTLIGVLHLERFAGIISTFSLLALLMAYAYKNNRAKLLNLAGGLAAIRIFIVYIELFGSLLATGVGLIVSGFVLLGIVFGWRKLAVMAGKKLKEKTNEAK